MKIQESGLKGFYLFTLSKHSDDSGKQMDLFRIETNSPPLPSGTTQVKLWSCPKLSANPDSNTHAHGYTECTRITKAFSALASDRVQHRRRKEKKTLAHYYKLQRPLHTTTNCRDRGHQLFQQHEPVGAGQSKRYSSSRNGHRVIQEDCNAFLYSES